MSQSNQFSTQSLHAGHDVRKTSGTRAVPIYQTTDVISFAKENNFQNLILVDNTADKDFVKNYPLFINHGFHLVSSNKIAKTLGIDDYRNL